MTTAGSRIARATVVAGTLDILVATGLTVFYGADPAAMLRGLASGPIPPAMAWGAGGSMLGLVVHFALMAVMAAVYVAAADRWPALKTNAVLWGVIYGLVTYVVMNLIVVPLRFGTGFPPSLVGFATQLFCHVVLVGIPIAVIARR